MYSKVKDLPNIIQKALSNIGYNKSDIEILVRDKISPMNAGSSGQKGFFTMINLATSDVKSISGSYGGSNIFNQDNIVDNCDQSVPLNDGVVALKGSTGYKTFATLYVNNANVISTLPNTEVTPRQRWILYAMHGLTSAGRKNEFARAKKPPTIEEFKALEAMGFITIAKNGSMRITTNGKNASNRTIGQYVPYSD